MLNRFRNALYGTNAADDSSIRSEAERQRSCDDRLIGSLGLTRSASFREDLLSGLSKARIGNGSNNHNRNRQNNNSSPIKSKNQLSTTPSMNSRGPHNLNQRSSEANNRQVMNYPVAKYRYTRPDFLQLKTDDEILVSADHQIRPIILPRDVSRLPWKAGYAECINAGKSMRNEDQAVTYKDEIIRQSLTENNNHQDDDNDSIPVHHKIPWVYFGMFDGHAGTAVAVAAASQLHIIIRDKLNQIGDLLMSLEFGTFDQWADHYDDDHNATLENAQKTSSSLDAKIIDEDVKKTDADKVGSAPSKLTCREQKDPNLPIKPTDLRSSNVLKPVLEENEDENENASIEKTNADNDDAKIKNDNTLTGGERATSNGSDIDLNHRSRINHRRAVQSGFEDGWPSLIDMLRNNVTVDSLIIGVLESAFWEMDALIAQDKQDYKMPGGCTALVSLFILGKLYVCNAGDSRAIVYRGRKVVPMSNDFTPVSERERILRLGLQRQELLGNDFTHLEFIRRPTRKDLGKQILYKDAYMTGWSIKTATYDDLRFPLVWGEGKRSRVLATIGVTRGFGDHELRSQYGSVPIKPFLTPEPEVKVLRLDDDDSLQDEDVLIMGTDGLWDVTRNDEAAAVVESSIYQISLFPDNEESRSKYRYITAAQDLVIHSRGHTNMNDWNNVWRTAEDKLASYDDISVFVIPLKQYRDEYNEWLRSRDKSATMSMSTSTSVMSSQVE